MKTILIPVDFSDLSAYGSSLAMDVAKHTGAQLHFVHVISLPSHVLLTPEGDLFEDGDFDTSIPRKQKAEAEQKMEEWKAKYDSNATTCVCFGKVNEELMNYTKAHDASLIVMGTHQTVGVKELLQSSHAEFLALHSDVPILSLKCDRSDMKIKSMVLAASFKTPDVPNCETALLLSQAFDAQLHLLRVNTSSDILPDTIVMQNMQTFAEKHKIKHANFAIANHHDVEDGIMEFVAQYDIDVLAIGSKQRTGLNKIINGCLSADLVNHALKPILTFKLKD
jgi:nucleotide-binding universal stress UspA family protein